jgi:hypothetical protein
MESATVKWHPIEDVVRNPNTVVWNSKDRTFESVENAVRFIMETLSAGDRATVTLQTDSRSIDLAEIDSIYADMKRSEGPAGETK